MTEYRISRSDVIVLRDILDMAGVIYDLDDFGNLSLEADYDKIMDKAGISYFRI